MNQTKMKITESIKSAALDAGQYTSTINAFRAAMRSGGEAQYGVIYVRVGVQDFYPELVKIDPPGEYCVEGELISVALGRESLGNAAGPASVRCARIARAIGALDAEESDEAAGIGI